MFKITAIFALALIGVVCASGSCQSCGPECVSACGTRRFRTCCFNYLRRKRGPDTPKLFALNLQGNKLESILRPKFPISVFEEPEVWSMTSDYKPITLDDIIENGVQIPYEA